MVITIRVSIPGEKTEKLGSLFCSLLAVSGHIIQGYIVYEKYHTRDVWFLKKGRGPIVMASGNWESQRYVLVQLFSSMEILKCHQLPDHYNINQSISCKCSLQLRRLYWYIVYLWSEGWGTIVTGIGITGLLGAYHVTNLHIRMYTRWKWEDKMQYCSSQILPTCAGKAQAAVQVYSIVRLHFTCLKWLYKGGHQHRKRTAVNKSRVEGKFFLCRWPIPAKTLTTARDQVTATLGHCLKSRLFSPKSRLFSWKGPFLWAILSRIRPHSSIRVSSVWYSSYRILDWVT